MEKVIAKVIEKILEQMSPELRVMIIEAVRKLEVTAEKTENPWDDILVMILKVVFDIK